MILIIDHDSVVKCAHRLPPLPQSATRLAILLASQEPDLREIARVIEYDPTLTMKILRVANSALGSARRRIGTVPEALIRLGTGTVAGFAMGACVRPLLGTRIPGYNFSESEFWQHSLAAALAAESIQAHSSQWTGMLSFTAALLHDIGKLVLGQFLNTELSGWLERAVSEGNQTAFQAEKEILSLHHGEAGGIIAQHWGLPDCIVQGIVYHHSPEECTEGICSVTFLANLVAHALGTEQSAEAFTTAARVTEDFGFALARLGLAEQDLVKVFADTRKGLQAVSGQMD